jgi:hypothetical protein
MTSEENTVDVAMIERLIAQIRGILAVRVVQDEHGQINELHVVGSPERSAKQMVRDVESLLFVRGGVRLDHRKISLVQVAATVMQPTIVRVQLLDIARSTADQVPTIAVTLGMGERRVQGIGRGRGDQPEPAERMIGYATIHALDQLIGPQGQFRLENLQRQQFGQLEVFLSHLSLVTDDGIETLLGISAARSDDLSSVARAILDAVNRRLQRMLGEIRPTSR